MENLIWIAGVAGAIILALFKSFTAGKNAGKNEQRSKEADSYEKHLSDIADANAARSSVTDSLPDKDKYRRD